MIFSDIREFIGETPMVYLEKISAQNHCIGKIAAKAESFNPGGSAKDRAVLKMIEYAEKTGHLRKGGTVIEATSGNTGIAIAMLCAVMGYKAIITMPEDMTHERIALMKAYGAEVILTKADEGMNGAIKKAAELSNRINNSVFLNQFSNFENTKAHYESTGSEIWKDTNGKINYLVAGIGTSGTICGCAKLLKEKNNGIKIIGVLPKTEKHRIKAADPAGQKIQGIGAGFVPKICDLSLIDEIIYVASEDAARLCRELVLNEGLLCGTSSGAVLAAAVEVAKRKEANNKLVCVILHDSGERYLLNDDFS